MDKIKTAIGLMSGTSMDGIDIALLTTDGRSAIEFGPTGFAAYEAAFAQRIGAALDSAASIMERTERPGDLADLEAEITTLHGQAVGRFLRDNDICADAIDVIGFHGQTVLHRPAAGLTVQLGDGAALARQTGIDVVADMRANDIDNGGQGAPLVPVFHQALAKRVGDADPVAFVNIGGIANVTFAQEGRPPMALDTGPGNALIDQWVRRTTNFDMDENGALGISGRVHGETVSAYLSDPFFARSAPKSLDRGDFTLSLMPDLGGADGAATLAEVTAAAIAQAARLVAVAPGRWVVSGGGAQNRAIVARLKRHLGDDAVMVAEQAGLSSNAMEAQAWAYLAVRSLRGLALTFPTTTGCEEPVTGGVHFRA